MRNSKCLFWLLAAGMLACGGSDSSGPSPAYASVDGTWNITGSFDNIPSNLANFAGTITFQQASRANPPTGASANISVFINGSTGSITAIHNVALTTAGVLTFQLGTANQSATWGFTGTVSGSTINGSHVLTDGTNSFPGPWQAHHS